MFVRKPEGGTGVRPLWWRVSLAVAVAIAFGFLAYSSNGRYATTATVVCIAVVLVSLVVWDRNRAQQVYRLLLLAQCAAVLALGSFLYDTLVARTLGLPAASAQFLPVGLTALAAWAVSALVRLFPRPPL